MGKRVPGPGFSSPNVRLFIFENFKGIGSAYSLFLWGDLLGLHIQSWEPDDKRLYCPTLYGIQE